MYQVYQVYQVINRLGKKFLIKNNANLTHSNLIILCVTLFLKQFLA